jgi:hypothetical protein
MLAGFNPVVITALKEWPADTAIDPARLAGAFRRGAERARRRAPAACGLLARHLCGAGAAVKAGAASVDHLPHACARLTQRHPGCATPERAGDLGSPDAADNFIAAAAAGGKPRLFWVDHWAALADPWFTVPWTSEASALHAGRALMFLQQ